METKSLGLIRTLLNAALTAAIVLGVLWWLKGSPSPAPPGPAPVPPAPHPPAPQDPLTQKLLAAYQSDSGSVSDKAAAKLWLVDLYAAAADFAKDPAVTGTADLLGRVKAAAGTRLKDTDIRNTRQAIAVEIATVMPSEGPLTDAVRQQAADLFRRISVSLGSF